MIAVDTSALMAILLDEPEREKCLFALGAATHVNISAGTIVEALVAAEYRGIGVRMNRLIASAVSEVQPVTAETGQLAWTAFRTFGKGRHPAKLNFGDCFSYAIAKQLACPLLFIGNDFSQTDIQSAL